MVKEELYRQKVLANPGAWVDVLPGTPMHERPTLDHTEPEEDFPE